jgi:hypothetical protein
MLESSVSRKENTPLNAPLKQVTLLSALDKGITKGRKRTITLVNGGQHARDFVLDASLTSESL